MNNIQEIWSKVYKDLKTSYTKDTFDLYFSNLNEISDYKEGFIYIVVNSPALKNKLRANYLKDIQNLINNYNYSDNNIGIKFVTKDELNSNEQIINKTVVKPNINRTYDVGFRTQDTFDTFVVGDSNKQTYNVCTKVVGDLGRFANPLYIFGDVGLGKSHVMNAIGNFVFDTNPDKKVRYVKSYDFRDDYIKHMRDAKKKEKGGEKYFKDKYYDLDLLLIDDIQLINDSSHTLNEFFNIFEKMTIENKQIVITSDRPATEINKMNPRITTRLASGFNTKIKKPDLETRIKILESKLENTFYGQDINVPRDVLEYIAVNYDSNIRNLESTLDNIVKDALILESEITIERTISLLSDDLKSKNTVTNKYDQRSIDNLIDSVCDLFTISRSEITGKGKSNKVVFPRRIAWYILYEYYNLTFEKIGELFNRTHSNVSKANKVIEDALNNNDKELRRSIEQILKKNNFK